MTEEITIYDNFVWGKDFPDRQLEPAMKAFLEAGGGEQPTPEQWDGFFRFAYGGSIALHDRMRFAYSIAIMDRDAKEKSTQ